MRRRKRRVGGMQRVRGEWSGGIWRVLVFVALQLSRNGPMR
jgi:hypothetical protein